MNPCHTSCKLVNDVFEPKICHTLDFYLDTTNEMGSATSNTGIQRPIDVGRGHEVSMHISLQT